MFKNTSQAAAIHLNGLVVLIPLVEFLAQTPAGVDVAGYFHFRAGAPQVAVRVDHASHSRRGAARGSTAEQFRQNLRHEIGNRAYSGKQKDGPYPELISPGLDDVHDAGCLNEK